jgi:hypothetical protein
MIAANAPTIAFRVWRTRSSGSIVGSASVDASDAWVQARFSGGSCLSLKVDHPARSGCPTEGGQPSS